MYHFFIMQFIDVYFKDYIYNINKEEFEKKALYSCFKDGILLSEKLDELVSLDSDTVRNFVDFLNGKGTIIDTSNVIALSMLADMFKVSILKEITNSYKELHAIEIVQDYFSKYDGKCNDEYLNLIADVLYNFFDEVKLLDFSTDLIREIIQKFIYSHPINKSLLDFIFKYIEFSDDSHANFLLNLIPALEDENENYFLEQIYEKSDNQKKFECVQPCHYIYLYKQNIRYKEMLNLIDNLIHRKI